jgi:hypothetical protein
MLEYLDLTQGCGCKCFHFMTIHIKRQMIRVGYTGGRIV